MVWDERTAQEPKTAFSGKLEFLRFSARFSTHFEIVDGHLFIIFKIDFAASLGTNVYIQQMLPQKGEFTVLL